MPKSKEMGQQAPHFRPPKRREEGGRQGVAAAMKKQRIARKEVQWKDLQQLQPLPPLPPATNRACKHATAPAVTDPVHPALEEIHEDPMPPPGPPDQSLDLEICFRPELPARSDLGQILADLQLLMAELGSTHLVDNAAWPPGHYLKVMHLSLPPEQAQLFRDLVRGKDPARPGAHPMPRDRDRNFIFSDLGQAQLRQQQRRDQGRYENRSET